MQDFITGQDTFIRGRVLPGAFERDRLQHDHGRRLASLDRLGQAAAQCGLRADSDRDLVLLAEDEVSLLEATGGHWAALGEAIRDFRRSLPIRPLEDFGFSPAAENPLEENNPLLRRLGGGVEAWAFVANDGSVYKFYLPREEKRIGSVFGFATGDEAMLQAEAVLGDYRGILEKIMLIHALGGMAAEIVAVTPEGIVVAKQVLGDPLAQGDDMSTRLPEGLIEIPSRFLRANRDHPRLFFFAGKAWLVADLHARNFVRCEDGALRVIDLVVAEWPRAMTAKNPLLADWLERVEKDPSATFLTGSRDEEL